MKGKKKQIMSSKAKTVIRLSFKMQESSFYTKTTKSYDFTQHKKQTRVAVKQSKYN